jgi:ribulose kinase
MRIKRIVYAIFLWCSFYTATAQVPSNVPTNGLVGYWPFNGNSNDVSGNNLNGTVTGASLTTDRNRLYSSLTFSRT